MAKLRLGIIGAGAMGLSHLKAFHEATGDRAEVVAICANNKDNLQKARAVAADVRILADASALIKSDLDAVVVATPNFTHVPLALEVLNAGKHLFLEKPCGITREECHALVEASEQSQRVVMIGHELRYSRYFQRIRELIMAGEIGPPRTVWTREFRGPFQKKSQDWIQNRRKSGGALVDKSCHHFDLMNWWTNSRPKRVAAFGNCAVNRVLPGDDQVHDNATVSWEYDNGVVGTLQLCMFARDIPDEDLEMGVIGDTGTLQTRLSSQEILQWKRGQKEPIIHKLSNQRRAGWGDHLGFVEIHEAFLNAVLKGERPLTAPADCVDGTLLAIAAEEAIQRQTVVEVS